MEKKGKRGTLRYSLFLSISIGLIIGATVLPGQADGPVYLSTSNDLMDASRGEGRFAGSPPDTTFIIRNGIYFAERVKVLLYVTKGGLVEAPRRFVGESRDGVIIQDRATIAADFVELHNLTFDLSEYERSQNQSFNTITIVNAGHIRLNNLFCTGKGDKGRRGGHIAFEYYSGQKIPEAIIVENCVIEKFGRFDNPEGKLDHGIYISAVRKLVLRNNEIRDNAGRGIQFYTSNGGIEHISDVLIENNIIHHNGYFPYADGILISAGSSVPKGTIKNITIRNNLIYKNAFSGIRLNTSASENITIENNTFYHNSFKFSRGAEIFIDDSRGGKDVAFTKNIFVPNTVAMKGWKWAEDVVFHDNIIDGEMGDEAAFDNTNLFISAILTDPEAGDFRCAEPDLSDYGYQF